MKNKSSDVAWYRCKKCGYDEFERHKGYCEDGCDYSEPVYWHVDEPVKRGFWEKNQHFWWEGAD